ncbi:MAG: transcriptional regulator GlxA family with amidase domain [Oceanicoccus sp.]|jgi:transcriptional regulator GlxA family with amidase domain
MPIKRFMHFLSSILLAHGDDIVQQVSSLIQQTMGDKKPLIDNIATLLGLSRRSLQRRLTAKEVVFKTLLHDIRIKTACWYLTSSTIDITLLAEILGYSDASGFSRAFKKTIGQSPMKWKQSNSPSH